MTNPQEDGLTNEERARAEQIERWRVGRTVGRTIYAGDRLIGLMDSPTLAARVVEAVNGCAADAAELARVTAERDELRGWADDRDELMAQRDAFEEQIGNIVASVGLECEWSNFHSHTDCVGEAFAAVEAERNAARRELAEARAENERLATLLHAMPGDNLELAADRDSWLKQCEDARDMVIATAADRDRLAAALREARGTLVALGREHTEECMGKYGSPCDDGCPARVAREALARLDAVLGGGTTEKVAPRVPDVLATKCPVHVHGPGGYCGVALGFRSDLMVCMERVRAALAGGGT